MTKVTSLRRTINMKTLDDCKSVNQDYPVIIRAIPDADVRQDWNRDAIDCMKADELWLDDDEPIRLRTTCDIERAFQVYEAAMGNRIFRKKRALKNRI